MSEDFKNNGDIYVVEYTLRIDYHGGCYFYMGEERGSRGMAEIYVEQCALSEKPDDYDDAKSTYRYVVYKAPGDGCEPERKVVIAASPYEAPSFCVEEGGHSQPLGIEASGADLRDAASLILDVACRGASCLDSKAKETKEAERACFGDWPAESANDWRK